MRLVLSTNTLGIGGSETYLVTLADRLAGMGHEVTLHAASQGPMAEVARALGLSVVGDADLPERCEAAVVQDGPVALEIARRYPQARLLFVAHSTIFDLQTPPQLGGLIGDAVALNDRVGRHLRVLAVPPRVTRLRQPIDVQRFAPDRPPARRPRRALVLSNRLGWTREILAGACAEAGIELVEVGVATRPALEPDAELRSADIVFGYGRSILEAMACGRAAYVLDYRGGDGWVTAGSYAALEADGFAGSAGLGPIDAARLRADLAAYRPEMGAVNRDLVTTHHRADPHAEAIVELLGDAAPARASGPLEEMARLARLQWREHSRAWALGRRNEELGAENERLREALAARDAELSRLRWRLAGRARRALDRLRGRRGERD